MDASGPDSRGRANATGWQTTAAGARTATRVAGRPRPGTETGQLDDHPGEQARTSRHARPVAAVSCWRWRRRWKGPGERVVSGRASGDRDLLGRVQEWNGRGVAGDRAPGCLDPQLGARAGVLDRDPDIADVLAQPRRPDQVGDMADPVPVAERGPERGNLELQRVSRHFNADKLARDALRAHPVERGLADVVPLLRLDQSLHAGDLQRVILQRHVGVVVEDAGLDPARLARRDRPDLVALTRGHDRVPQIIAPGRVPQENLVPDLAGPARPADHDLDAIERRVRAEVVPQPGDLVAEQVTHQWFRLGPLDLDRIDRRFVDGDVEARAERHTARPQ